jgi:hypothetical protein
VISAMPTGSSLPDERRSTLLRAAFTAILDEEAGRLTTVSDLISELRAKLG